MSPVTTQIRICEIRCNSDPKAIVIPGETSSSENLTGQMLNISCHLCIANIGIRQARELVFLAYSIIAIKASRKNKKQQKESSLFEKIGGFLRHFLYCQEPLRKCQTM